MSPLTLFVPMHSQSKTIHLDLLLFTWGGWICAHVSRGALIFFEYELQALICHEKKIGPEMYVSHH